jgi:hypothetical protein
MTVKLSAFQWLHLLNRFPPAEHFPEFSIFIIKNTVLNLFAQKVWLDSENLYRTHFQENFPPALDFVNRSSFFIRVGGDCTGPATGRSSPAEIPGVSGTGRWPTALCSCEMPPVVPWQHREGCDLFPYLPTRK